MSKETGGPAFPTTKPLDGWGDPNTGMTLRDWFAGLAMQRIITANSLVSEFPIYALEAYKMADAMLKAREE